MSSKLSFPRNGVSPANRGQADVPPGAVDEEVLGKLRQRDPTAFSELFDRYHTGLVRLARVFVGSTSVAEEVAQDTWVALITGLDGFEGRASLRTWLFRVLANRAKTRGLRERRVVSFSDFEPDHSAVEGSRFHANGFWSKPPQPWDTESPEKLLADQQAVELLTAAIEQLPENQRAVVSLRDIDGLDSVEVCNILEISETNQRVLLHRARAKLRTTLEEHYGHRSR